MDATKAKRQARDRRRSRIRSRITGTPERPRLSVFRSNSGIYAQLIDDSKGATVAAASTLDDQVAGSSSSKGNKDAAKAVGLLLAERAKAAGVEAAVFDRGGNQYTGRVAALAEGAREGGLRF